jgi:hypothetical protein
MKKSLIVRGILVVVLLGAVLVGCMPPGPKPTVLKSAIVVNQVDVLK